ncbi:cyclin-dependent kinase inhibitor 7-like [Rhodamnia argentea]|uniref:Cyclin-dependent kinase inhibitor 7-like n=1 Tax=Rhodamnia argentea TaxID=178133 RepID=A0ABM3HHA4_9MYRT|nr:cyclin-dependent kinase inhibitor 7-like [Rhodamnia argentea]
MVRKRRGNAELEVMDIAGVGVRTRARASLAAASSVPAVAKVSALAAKRRRVGAREEEEEEEEEKELKSSCGSPPCDRLLVRSGGRERHSGGTTPENSLRPAPATGDRCLSPSSHDFASVSCCSSNGSSEVEKEMINFVDLEEESDGVEASTYHRRRRERREKTPSSEVGAESDDMGSASKPTSEANSRWRPKMPTQAELDDFFAVAEKNQALEAFKDKYNFDFVKEGPLKGRYEWSRIENKAEERSN